MSDSNKLLKPVDEFDEILRAEMVMKVMILKRTKKMTIPEACKEVAKEHGMPDFSERTYYHWRNSGAVNTIIAEANKDAFLQMGEMIASSIVSITEDVIADGKNEDTAPRDRLNILKELRSIQGEWRKSAPEESSKEKDYLAKKGLLPGVTLKDANDMEDGDEVTIKVSKKKRLPSIIDIDQSTP